MPGKGLDIVGPVENFFRRTAIGGNSTPRWFFAGGGSGSFLVDVAHRSCIFRSRREIFSLGFAANSMDDGAACSSIISVGGDDPSIEIE